MVRIRLKRMGRRHRAYFRLTVVDQRRPRDSKVLEDVGTYDPCDPDPAKQVAVKRGRIDYWLSVGAQPSDTVRRLLDRPQTVSLDEKRPVAVPAAAVAADAVPASADA